MAEKKTQVAKETATEKTPNRIKVMYDNTVVPALVKKFNYKNVNQAPKLVKITINSGLGDVKDNGKSVQLAQEELKLIAGQKPTYHREKVCRELQNKRRHERRHEGNFKRNENVRVLRQVHLHRSSEGEGLPRRFQQVVRRQRQLFDGR